MSSVERSSDPGRPALKEHIERFDMATTGVSAWHPITYAVHDEAGDLPAASIALSRAATCLVEALWVREDCRNQGIGSALMAAVEQEASRLGCHQIAVETHSFQAPEFYERRGFARVGEVTGYPRGHSHISLAKPLASTSR